MIKWTILIIIAAFIVTVVWFMHAAEQTQELEDLIVAFKNENYEAAVPRLERFADQGEPAAVRLVALAYVYGYGVQANPDAAAKYLGMLSDAEQQAICAEHIRSVHEGNNTVGSYRESCVQ